MAQDVLCEVKSCIYYDNGDRCSAPSIYVVNQNTEHASASTETDCKTFESKTM